MPLLTDSDLREIGIPLGPRRLILAGVAEQQQTPASESTAHVSSPTENITGAPLENDNPQGFLQKESGIQTGSGNGIGITGLENSSQILASDAIPMIGRERDMSVLRQCWTLAGECSGQVVVISGEPGIGKSRILSAFCTEIDVEKQIKIKLFGSPDHVASPFYPVITQLRNAAGCSTDELQGILQRKLAKVIPHDQAAPDRIDLFADLLSNPTERKWRGDPQVQKQRTLDALLRQVEGLARSCTVLVTFEDAHWIDASSLEMMSLLVKSIERLPVMILVTARPEFTPPWPAQNIDATTGAALTNSLVLTLGRLDVKANRSLVEAVAKGEGLKEETVEQITDRTEGVPLFIQEVTRAVVESRHSEHQNVEQIFEALPLEEAIPDTLEDSLAARLDHLGSAIDVAQIGSVIGREFERSLLTAAADGKILDLDEKLRKLIKSKLIVAVQKQGEICYRFSHALVQDAALSSLEPYRRAAYHARVAAALEQGEHGGSRSELEVQAYHWAQAGKAARAIEGFIKAAEVTLSRCAAAETKSLLDEAVGLIGPLQNENEQKRYEIEIQLLKAQVFVMLESVSSPLVGLALNRARSLALELGDEKLLAAALAQLWCHDLFTGSPRKALEDSRVLLEVANKPEREGQKVDRFNSHLAMALVEQNLGNMTSSLVHFKQAQALEETTIDGDLVVLGFSPKVVVRSFQAWVLFQLGFPEQALAMSSSAIELAEEQGHAMTICMSLAMDSVLLFGCRDDKSLQRCGEKFQSLAIEHVLPFYISIAALSLGAAMVLKNSDRAGLDVLKEGLEFARQVGFGYQSGVLGCTNLESLLLLGETKEGLEYVAEVLKHCEQTGEKEFYPELLRLKGEFLVLERHLAEAEVYFDLAKKEAKEQNAKLWELRSALSLSRLYCDRGELAKAQSLVRPIHDWFTEGFFLAELQEAKSLLEL